MRDDNPVFVECFLVDAHGRHWTFIEKVPVVSMSDINAESHYPIEELIEVDIEKQWTDDEGKERILVKPKWSIESVEGVSEFELYKEQLIFQKEKPEA